MKKIVSSGIFYALIMYLGLVITTQFTIHPVIVYMVAMSLSGLLIIFHFAINKTPKE